MKRFLSIFLALSMVFGFSLSSFAVGTKIALDRYTSFQAALYEEKGKYYIVLADEYMDTLSNEQLQKIKTVQNALDGSDPNYEVLVLFAGFNGDAVGTIRFYLVENKDAVIMKKFYHGYSFAGGFAPLMFIVNPSYINTGFASIMGTIYDQGFTETGNFFKPDNLSYNLYNICWATWDFDFPAYVPVLDIPNLNLKFGRPVPDAHDVTVNYQYEDGTQAAEPVTQSIEVGKDFEIVSPSITGYTPSQAKITGTMGESSQEYTVTYKKNIHKLTVNYVYASGGTASNTVWKTLGYGDSYSIPSPMLPNLTADKPIVSGTMPDNDLNVTVTYQSSVVNHTLTINYVYQDGSKAVESVVKKLPCNVSYLEKSPEIQGYIADKPIVSGRMPDSDYTETVTYIKVDSGGGDSGGDGGNSGGGDSGGDGGDSGGGDSGGDSGSGDGNDPFQPPDGGGSGGGGNDPFQPPDGGGSGGGNDPFQPPDSGGSGGGWSGYDPFKPPSGGSGWNGYDPFKRPQQNNWIGSNPFEKPKQSIPYTSDPFQKPEDAPTKGDAHQAFLYFIGGMK